MDVVMVIIDRMHKEGYKWILVGLT